MSEARPLTRALLAAGATLLLIQSSCAANRGTMGAVLAQQPDGEVVLREVPEGLAAARAGLAPGDQLLLIDGLDVRAMSSEGIHRALSGNVGDTLRLTLLRGEQVIRVTLKLTKAVRSKGRRSPVD